MGFDHRVGHFRPPGMVDEFPNPRVFRDGEQNPQSVRRNNFPGEQIPQWFLLLSENLSASNYPGAAGGVSPWDVVCWGGRRHD